jgi:hypothetical protein
MTITGKTSADDTAEAAEGAAETATRMHRPKHGPLDTIETSAEDEIQHEAALRDSALRAPR